MVRYLIYVHVILGHMNLLRSPGIHGVLRIASVVYNVVFILLILLVTLAITLHRVIDWSCFLTNVVIILMLICFWIYLMESVYVSYKCYIPNGLPSVFRSVDEYVSNSGLKTIPGYSRKYKVLIALLLVLGMSFPTLLNIYGAILSTEASGVMSEEQMLSVAAFYFPWLNDSSSIRLAAILMGLCWGFYSCVIL